MLASDVLTDVRYALSDTAKDRWSDARLLALLNDAIRDVAFKTRLFNERTYLEILDNITRYDISSIAHEIIRIEWNNLPIPFKSHEEMDNVGKNSNNSTTASQTHNNSSYTGQNSRDWKSVEGTEPQLIIYDKQDAGQFTLYPIIQDGSFAHLADSGSFGIITDILYEDLQIIINDDFGTLNPPGLENWLYIYYKARHATLTAISDTVDINEIYKDLLVNYVVAKSLIDNIDTMNREMSTTYFGLYTDRLAIINENMTVSNTDVTPTTSYRSME